jgi:hypothetical protein
MEMGYPGIPALAHPPPSGTNDVQAYTQMAFPEAETTWDPNEPGG